MSIVDVQSQACKSVYCEEINPQLHLFNNIIYGSTGCGYPGRFGGARRFTETLGYVKLLNYIMYGTWEGLRLCVYIYIYHYSYIAVPMILSVNYCLLVLW